MLFLVRHAKAGDRHHHEGDDHTRPLTANGRKQAAALVGSLQAAGAAAPLLASPFTRCVQTLEPLAEALATEVTTDGRLAEGAPFAPVIDLLGTLPDGAVLCSHGDLIPEVIAALQRRGCAIVDEPSWKKASVWALTRDADGRVTAAASWPPPA